jgi:nucleoside-diphosphate-sugar epimerase
MSAVLRRLNLSVVVRVIADMCLVSFGLLAGLMVLIARNIGLIQLGASWGAPPDGALSTGEVWSYYFRAAPTLTLIAILTFTLSGFYTRGRYYTSRYKAIVVAQAVTLTYLIFGFTTVFVTPASPHPRSSLVVAWFVTLVAIMIARLWSAIWRTLLRLEQSPNVQRTGAVHRVLVIGGAGYIGSVLCRQLLARGYYVRVLDALLYGDDAIRDILGNPRFEFVGGDSRDAQSVVGVMRGVDAVVHLGEIVGDPATSIDFEITREVNVAATRMLAEVAKGFGVERFVYASSCSVYGASDGVLTEMSELNPVSEYARAKVAAETILLKLNDQQFNPVILRFATVFGLSPRPRFDLAINVLTAKAIIDREIPVSGGDQWRPFIHVSDVAQAIVRAVEAPLANVKGKTFNVGGDDLNYTILAAAEEIGRAVPDARLLIDRGNVDARNYRVSFARIRRELGFTPGVSLQEGIAELAAAIREQRVGHYSELRYSNFRTLSDNGALHAMRSQPINELYAIRSIAPRNRPPTPFHDRRRNSPGRRASDYGFADASRRRMANVAQA